MDILLNGLTLQLAGEVLFYDHNKLDPFREYRKTYTACLSDLAFSILFAESTLVSGGIPIRGGRNPGKTLVETFGREIKILDTHPSLGTGVPDKPEKLLDKNNPNWSENSNAIVQRIANFCSNYQRAPEELQEWIKREADADFGADDSVFAYGIPLSEYKYQKEIPPMISREIQNNLPPYFVGPMSDAVTSVLQRKGGDRTFSRSAIEEFVSRNTLTHMVIDYWYDLKFNEETSKSIRQLPYITRRIAPWAEMHQIKSIIMPHALAAVLQDCTQHEPASFITVLKQKRESASFARIRELCDDYFMESKTMREETEKNLIDTIDAIRRQVGVQETPIFGTKTYRKFKEAFPDIENVVRDYVAQPGQADRELERIFPQFDRKLIVPPTGSKVIVMDFKNSPVSGPVIGSIHAGSINNSLNWRNISVTVPPPETVNIRSEVDALRPILNLLQVAEPKRLTNALDDAETEAAKSSPNKAVLANDLLRVLEAAKTAVAFTDQIVALANHLVPIASWLGEHGLQLLSTVSV
jgi:hypothetical protein